MTKCERLFRLAALLREGPRSVRDIARNFYPTASVGGPGWSGIERAVQRDLNDLARLEPDFEALSGRPPRYRIHTQRSSLHPVELLALHAAARLTYHRASGQALYHRQALQQLTKWLPEHLQPVVNRSLKDVGHRRSREDMNLEKVSQAWMDASPLRFEYQKPGGSGQWRTNIIETYLIEAHPQNLDLYVVGLETSFHRDVRTFKLSRMRGLQSIPGERYRIPDSFDPTAFFRSAWGVVGAQGNKTVRIELRFRADAAYRILEGGYAHLDTPSRQPDGSVLASVQAPLDGSGLPREVMPWILSWGPRVDVLGPPDIRTHWLAELREACGQSAGEENMTRNRYMGHSPSRENSEWQTLRDHVEGVTRRLEHHVRYLTLPGNVPELRPYARLTGYLHDLGKYRGDFQKYRLGWNPQTRQPQQFGEKAVPHSDAGAKVMSVRMDADREAGNELPLVIANHHGRLRDVDALETRLAETDPDEVFALLELAGDEFPELIDLYNADLPALPLADTERAFLIRFLLGALVDADRLDTEEHGSPGKAKLRECHAAEQDEMALLFSRLQAEQDRKAAEDARHPQPINALRREMYAQALERAVLPPGFFRLTLPTGGGKTLTSLAFALEHARVHGLRRVVYAVPFTTIIDQTAKVFRGVLEREGEFKVLEHHSNLEVKEREEGQEHQTSASELATENWDAPVIVTTTVRLFQETLFGTRTAQLRRLHNLTGSVIVLDEAQSLPAHLLRPVLDALQFLVRYGGCSVVLCTATQPALDESLGFPSLKGVRDLVPDAARYFDELRRVNYEFRLTEPTPWPTLAAELSEQEQVLCIVNTRQHARDLYGLLGEDEANFHLSTGMCPAHRKRELARIRERLAGGLPCRVVSTQLIEAGIDVDFPRVYRALGPLEAIVQAAGRCNREGKLEAGQVVVFRPEDHKMPRGDYEVRERLAASLLKGEPNLHDPAIFAPYFSKVYSNVSTAPKVKILGGEKDFFAAHAGLYFTQVADAFQMIEGDMLPVIIRGYEGARVDALLATLQGSHSKRERQDAWRALQQYTVNIYAHQADQLRHLLADVPELKQRADWLGVEPPKVRQWPPTAKYDDKLGIVPEMADDLFTTL
ncbi:CRISPR-associated endonuclease Cas3'' [Deinococcus carri]|uniref:CRISPR-associated endonuclease Cas3'' n=1 Tax=Deinococcus carri TaxID=1211323 RepID=UPI0031F187E9